jgi:hypothetical protein
LDESDGCYPTSFMLISTRHIRLSLRERVDRLEKTKGTSMYPASKRHRCFT